MNVVGLADAAVVLEYVWMKLMHCTNNTRTYHVAATVMKRNKKDNLYASIKQLSFLKHNKQRHCQFVIIESKECKSVEVIYLKLSQ